MTEIEQVLEELEELQVYNYSKNRDWDQIFNRKMSPITYLTTLAEYSHITHDEGSYLSSYSFYIDYLASEFHRKFNHLINANFYPKVVIFPDGHKYVIMCVSGINAVSGEACYIEYIPFYKATEDDISRLPNHVDDFIIRFNINQSIDTEIEINCYTPVTWLSYSKSVEENDVLLSGGECYIYYESDYEYYQYSLSQINLLYRLKSFITKEDQQNSWTDEFGCTYSIDKTKLIKCNSELIEYSIRPGTLCICDEAFKCCSFLESLIIPPSVVVIGKCAFEQCLQLKQLTIPNSILKIGTAAFKKCNNLEDVVFIDAPWGDCKRVYIPDSLFDSCERLRRVHLPNYIKRIGFRSFCGCKELEEINIPDSVEVVSSCCFEDCIKLKEISFPDFLYIFDWDILRNCSGIQRVRLPKDVRYWFNSSSKRRTSDYGCTSLQKVIIPTGCNINDYSEFIPEGTDIIQEKEKTNE